jgi:hypothetical protein
MLPLTAKNLAIFLFSTLLLPVFAAADDYPIELEVVSPVPPKLKGKKADPESHNIQYRSGWPLTFKLITTDEHLLGTLIQYANSPHGAYPESGEASALVFEDPDDCPSIEGRTALGTEFPCPLDPDEVFLEFTPGVDFPGLEDLHGRNDIHLLQDDNIDKPEWGGPGLPDFPEGSSDGVGYGPNDDLPGLVILSNVGVGIVYAPLVIKTEYEVEVCRLTSCSPDLCPCQDPPEDNDSCELVCDDNSVPVDPRPVDWQRADIEARHNLSGLMGSVAYELSDQERHTTVTTSMVVPRALFTHQVVEDGCYTGDSSDADCSGPENVARIIDGGPIVVGEDAPDFFVDTSQVEIRAFVVNGDAPAIVEDCDGKEGVTAADVECNVDPSTGGYYRLISNQVILNVEQRGGEVELCNNLVDPWGSGSNIRGYNVISGADLDLNTPVITEQLECPGGGGGVTRPPR